MFENFPYTNFHDLNLDWLIKKVKEAYSPDNPPDNLVLSVNGETGDVVLYQSENVVFPDVTSDQWRMVRDADGHTTGVLFNQNYMYVMYDNVADRVYTMNHPPQYPVTSVDGETGAVRVFPNAASRLPDVTEDYTNIRRQIQTDGTDNVVGIELKQNKAYRMKDASRYEIYDSGNPPPYPVTSVNGETGAIVIAIPFLDIESDDILFSEQASGHTWSLGRETQDGTASIQLVTNSTKAEAYVDFYDGEGLTFTKKLLTADDIPSSSGVVSVNGSTGVVVLYGTDIAISSTDNTTVSQAISNVNAAIDGIEDAIAIVANNNTHGAISSGQFVYVKNHGTLAEGLYKANTNIAANATLSSTNLDADSAGGLNALNDKITTYQDTFLFASGYCNKSISKLKTTSAIFLQVVRSDTSGYVWSGVTVSAQCINDGELRVFARDASGNAIDNASIFLNVLIVN